MMIREVRYLTRLNVLNESFLVHGTSEILVRGGRCRARARSSVERYYSFGDFERGDLARCSPGGMTKCWLIPLAMPPKPTSASFGNNDFNVASTRIMRLFVGTCKLFCLAYAYLQFKSCNSTRRSCMIHCLSDFGS